MRIPLLLLIGGLALPAEPAPKPASQPFTLAAIRVTPRNWDKEANFSTLERLARFAAAQGAQMVITPEGFLEGYVGNEKRVPGLTREKYRQAGESLDGPLLTRARSLAAELKIHLLLGFAEQRDGRMWNSVVIFSPGGGVVTHYSKTHTDNDEPFNTKGTEFPVVDTPYGRWGTLICMDRQLPETARILALKGAQVILVPAWGGYGEMNDVMMRTRAYENGVWVAFVHPNRTLIINPKGKIVTQDTGVEELVFATIDPAAGAGAGPIRNRRPELYGDLAVTPR
ncbi:MAG: carbon-nitrogen hydrolase family protein [Bryobacteraceae bacterium]